MLINAKSISIFCRRFTGHEFEGQPSQFLKYLRSCRLPFNSVSLFLTCMLLIESMQSLTGLQSNYWKFNRTLDTLRPIRALYKTQYGSMRYCLQSRVDTFKREKEFDLIDKKNFQWMVAHEILIFFAIDFFLHFTLSSGGKQWRNQVSVCENNGLTLRFSFDCWPLQLMSWNIVFNSWHSV